MSNSFMRLSDGSYFDLANPDPERININTIAHALSHICRFSGHTMKFYSVAQHSLLVSNILPRRLALQGLLHDAAEAFIGDVTRPVRMLCPEVDALEERIWAVIASKFGLPLKLDPEVVKADLTILMTEKRDLLLEYPQGEHDDNSSCWPTWVEPLKHRRITPLGPGVLCDAFICKYYDLQTGGV